MNFIGRYIKSIFLIWAIQLSAPVWAETGAVAVLYPEMREPYRQIFLEIINGMKDVSILKVRDYSLDNDIDEGRLGKKIKNEKIKAVVALGRRGLNAAKSLSLDVPIIVGAVLLPLGPQDDIYGGISLVPDPERFFSRLKEFQPKAEQVTIFYNPDNNQDLISLASSAAKKYNLKLNPVAVKELKTGTKKLFETIKQLKGSRHALWLLEDRSVLDINAILPEVLKQAWENQIITFSSNPAHVKKGILFALYPDNYGLGKSIAKIINEYAKGAGKSKIYPLSDLHIAINTRTAAHIGLDVMSDTKEQFKLIFPTE